LCLLGGAVAANAVVLFSPDTFEDGTIMDWGGADPLNVVDGAGHALQFSSGALGTRPFMAGDNEMARYTGDWLAAGANGVRVDLKGVGDPLQIHLVLFAANGARWETTSSTSISSTSGWVHAQFGTSDLVKVLGTGTLSDLLHNVNRVMLRHNTTLMSGGEFVTNGRMLVDNVEVVPEPASLGTLLLGGIALIRKTRNKAKNMS